MIRINNTAAAAKKLLSTILESKVIPIFDLDGVLLAAEHRQHSYTADDHNMGRCTLDQIGQLDLDSYRVNTTAAQVALDKNLPLMAVIEGLNARNYPYHIATARVVKRCKHSTKLLRDRGINPYTLICRQGDNDKRKDHILKQSGIAAQFSDPSYRARLVLIDDNMANCKAMHNIGVKAIKVDYVSPSDLALINLAIELEDAL